MSSAFPPPDVADCGGEPAHPGRGRRGSLFLLLGLLIAGGVALLVDMPIARLAVADAAGRNVHRFLETLEPFGQPTAVVLVAAAFWLVDRQKNSRSALLLLAAPLGAGLAADVLKLCIARSRPGHVDLALSAADTFLGVLPGLSAGSRGQSCPSAHTAVAVAFALALARLVPQGRWLFAALAALVAAQRIESGAHFVSDTCWGAATGVAWFLVLTGTIWREQAGGRSGQLPRSSVCLTEPFRSIDRDDVRPARVIAGAEALVPPSFSIASVSIVIPVYNEVENLARLHAELLTVVRNLARPIEILYVDDGSTDGSAVELARLARSDDRVVTVTLDRNHGQSAAILAGIRAARGDGVVLIDADLQNHPGDVPALLERLETGYDLVQGWRRYRHDRWLDRKMPSVLANRLIARMTGCHVHDTGCTLKALRRELACRLPLADGMHRFIPALAVVLGARLTEVAVRHRPRQFGRSKYGLSRVRRVLRDLVVVRSVVELMCRHRRLVAQSASATIRGTGLVPLSDTGRVAA